MVPVCVCLVLDAFQLETRPTDAFPQRTPSRATSAFPSLSPGRSPTAEFTDSKSAPPAVYIPAWTILRPHRCGHHAPLPSCLRSARHWTSGSGALLVSTRGGSERNSHLNRSVHLVSTSNGVSCLGDNSFVFCHSAIHILVPAENIQRKPLVYALWAQGWDIMHVWIEMDSS